MLKRTLLLLCLCLAQTMVMAMPARRSRITHTQADGTVLTLQLVGDEYLHFFLNLDTNERMLLGDDGDFFVLTDEAYQELKREAMRRQAANSAARQQRMAKRSMVAPSGPRRIGALNGSIRGSKKGLVILVNFSDQAMDGGHTQTTFTQQFNQEGYSANNHIGSVHDYFYDQSYGQFDLTFDVVGPVTVSQTSSYYGSNGSDGSDNYPATMVIEALKLVDSQVNFRDYDWDGDGEVDQVYVIYAGYGENAGAPATTIWPHEWTLSSANYFGDGSGAQVLDGVRIDTYACSCELSGYSGSSLNGIGTACHEFSHCLGFPDFYDTDYSGGIGMDSFDVMSGGSYNGPGYNGEVPAGYTAYERYLAGWLVPDVLDAGTTVTDMPALNEEPVAYVILNEANANEYYFLENRQCNRWFRYFDYNTAGHGLFVTHVDEDITVWTNNKPNDDPNHQRMSWIAADGRYGTYSSTYQSWSVTQSEAQGDFFPGTKNITSLTNTSHTSVGGKLFNKNTDGTYNMNHSLTEITENDGLISFLFDGGEVVDDGSRYTLTLNAGAGTCSKKSLTQTYFQEAFPLPICTAPNSGWAFIGWSTTPLDEESPNRPSTIYETGSTYLPTANATLYAVYKSVSATGEYVLLTEAPSDWSGQYLIAYPTSMGAYIMDGSLSSLDAARNFQSVFVSFDNTISADYDAYSFTIEPGSKSGAYTIKSASGLYIGGNVLSNTITQSTSKSYDNTLSFSNGYVNIVSGGHLRFSTSSEQRFRYYKLTSYMSQRAIQLYQKNGASSTTTYTTYPGGKPVLSSISIALPAATTTFNEGDAFSLAGLTLKAAYANGSTQVISEGFTSNPSEGEALSAGSYDVVVSYTEGLVTQTVTYPITVTELPKYAVSFMINGRTTVVNQQVANTAVEAPTVPPITVSINDEPVTYNFCGWATADVTSESTTKPAFQTFADGTYTPTQDTHFYAVYSRLSDNAYYTGYPQGFYVLGDGNNDGKTNVTDASTLVSVLSSGKVDELPASVKNALDMDGNGVLDKADLEAFILKALQREK